MANETRKTLEHTLTAEHVAMTAAKRLVRVKAQARLAPLAWAVRAMQAAQAHPGAK